jgi:hypothetical protein
VRRVLVTIVAVVLVLAAEIGATLSPTAASRERPRRAARVGAWASAPPYDGEPRIPSGSNAPAAVQAAASRLVLDYVLWSGGRLRMIPAQDATKRVIRLLEQQPKGTRLATSHAVDSVRIAPAGSRRYVATSAIGNFLVGPRGSRWLVVSLPGD